MFPLCAISLSPNYLSGCIVPPMSSVTYEFDVKMTCGGCSGAVTRALGKAEGLEKFEVSLENQTVIVHPTTATYDEVLEKIKKTGKEVRSGKTVDNKADDKADELGTKAADPAVPVEPPAV